MDSSSSPDLLADLQDEIVYQHAEKWQRFVNLLIDMIVVGIVNSIFGGIIQTIIFATYINDFNSIESAYSFPWHLFLIVWLVQISFFLAYYTIFEKMMKGRTVGKLVTGTMAVREDGNPLTWKNAILRSLCRLIPFEPIVALFTSYPWHDDFTNTVVVKKQL